MRTRLRSGHCVTTTRLLRKDMESVELTVDALHGQIETTMNDSLTSHATRHDQQHTTLLEKMDRLMERSPGTPSPTVPRPPVLGSGIQAVLSPAKRHQSLDTWGSNFCLFAGERTAWMPEPSTGGRGTVGDGVPGDRSINLSIFSSRVVCC